MKREPIVMQTEVGPITLDMTCSECDGAGRVASDRWIQWNLRCNELEQQIQERDGLDPLHIEGVLINDILNCNGYLDVDKAMAKGLLQPMPQESEQPVCPECEGIGTVPTEAGLALLQFHYRYVGRS